MDEPSARVVIRIGRLVEGAVEEALDEHEPRMHIPPPERGPLRAIPVPNLKLNDIQLARVREILEQGGTLDACCTTVDMPVSVIERCWAEYKPRWRRFLQQREVGA